jgi:hypothetical protein
MKMRAVAQVLKICLLFAGLILSFTIYANAQTTSTSKLKGTIYDAQGSVVVNAKVTAVSASKKKFEAFSKEDGEYELVLPFNKYGSSRNFKEAVYDISVESAGFATTVIKGYVFIPSQFGKMQMDLALKLGPINDQDHP